MYFTVYDTEDKKEVYNYLKGLQLPYKVLAEPVFRERTEGSNRYYHKYIVRPLADYLGMTHRETHEQLLVEFALIEEEERYRKIIYTVESTRGMTTERFEKYCEGIRIWAMAFLGVRLLKPGETWSDELDFNLETKYVFA